MSLELVQGPDGTHGAAGHLEAPWYALQVRPQAERRAQDRLIQAGLVPYLPLYTERRRWTDRNKLIERCLFPGYLFARFWWRERRVALNVSQVLRIVGEVPDAEIDAVLTLLRSGLPVQVVAWRPPVAGEKVRIEYGPFRGVEGVVTRIKGREHVVVSIELLNRAIATEFDSADVVPIPSPRRLAA